MGGDLPIFEEEKVSSDVLDRVLRVFNEQPLYAMMSLGLFIYVILMYFFIQRQVIFSFFTFFREQSFIHDNPEIQWHLKQIRKEDESLQKFVKTKFKQEQKKRRDKRKEFQRKYREEQISKMSPEEQQARLEKMQKKKEQIAMNEQELYAQVLAY